MTADTEAFQRLLHGMRESFLDELAERCDRLESMILTLENLPGDQEAFNELYRGVHSLKGSGGTHGLGIITAICHQLENFLTDVASKKGFGEAFANRALAYVDLLRRVESPARSDNPDYADIEAALASLRQTALQSRKAGLIAESSTMMIRIYEAALATFPVQLTVVHDGLAALDCLTRNPFDFAIIGRELKDLNGIAVISALRSSQGANQDIPVVLISSNREGIPAHARIQTILARDQKLAANLSATAKTLLGS